MDVREMVEKVKSSVKLWTVKASFSVSPAES